MPLTADDGTIDVGKEIAGRRWELMSILVDGRQLEGAEEAGAYMVLGSDMMVQGRGGCNRFFGAYSLAEDLRSFGNIASTKMYCHETMHVEDAFFRALGLIMTLSVQERTLEMRSDDSSTVLRFKEAYEEGQGLSSSAPSEDGDQTTSNAEEDDTDDPCSCR